MESGHRESRTAYGSSSFSQRPRFPAALYDSTASLSSAWKALIADIDCAEPYSPSTYTQHIADWLGRLFAANALSTKGKMHGKTAFTTITQRI
eukprot:5100584-Pleurochrysis_carterae.AAC.1